MPAAGFPNYVDLLLDAVFVVNLDGRIVHVSAACERIFGYTPDEMVGHLILDFVAPEDRERTRQEAALVIAGEPRIGFENRYVRKDGRRVQIMWSARWSEADRLRIGVARDVTGQKHSEAIQAATYAVSEAAHKAPNLDALLQEVHRIVAELVPLSVFAVATCDPKTRHLSFVYQADEHGNTPVIHEPVACRFCDRVICEGRPMMLGADALAAPDDAAVTPANDPCSLALPLTTENESIGVLVLRGAPGTSYSERDRELLRFVSAQIAIAIERAQLHAELLRAALYDELTALPNRRLFHDRLGSALARAARTRRCMALLYLDIDNFKQVNDSLGHATGDVLLREVALRLKRCVRATDTVARLGGDEFVVLLEDVKQPDDALAVAQKIRNVMREPVAGPGIETGASIGIAHYPGDGLDGAELLRRADEAMFADKRSKSRPGKSNVPTSSEQGA